VGKARSFRIKGVHWAVLRSLTVH